MTDWMSWCALAGAAVMCEMLTGTFYLLMIALGLAAGGAAAWFGFSGPVQFIVAGLVGIIALYALLHSRLGRRLESATDPAHDPNINLDIGQMVEVVQWHHGMARVMHRGALWDVQIAAGEEAVPGTFVIREVRGNRFIVSRS